MKIVYIFDPRYVDSRAVRMPELLARVVTWRPIMRLVWRKFGRTLDYGPHPWGLCPNMGRYCTHCNEFYERHREV